MLRKQNDQNNFNKKLSRNAFSLLSRHKVTKLKIFADSWPTNKCLSLEKYPLNVLTWFLAYDDATTTSNHTLHKCVYVTKCKQMFAYLIRHLGNLCNKNQTEWGNLMASLAQAYNTIALQPPRCLSKFSNIEKVLGTYTRTITYKT